MPTFTVPKGGRRKSVAHHARRASLFANFAGTFSRRGPEAPRQGVVAREKAKKPCKPAFRRHNQRRILLRADAGPAGKKVSSCARQVVGFSV
jgi:hypothetical protein